MPEALETALVLFSGGQDSTVCLAWALERFIRVETIGFAYGQRNAAELDARPRVLDQMASMRAGWAKRLGEDHLVELAALGKISHSALTSDIAIETSEGGLPTTFVPGRNLVFFAVAGAVAYRPRAKQLDAPRGQASCRRHVRKRLREFSRFPRRDHQGNAGCPGARNGSSPCHPHTPDVARQGGGLRVGPRNWWQCFDRFADRRNPHLPSWRRPAPARLGAWLWRMPGLLVASGRLCEVD